LPKYAHYDEITNYFLFKSDIKDDMICPGTLFFNFSLNLIVMDGHRRYWFILVNRDTKVIKRELNIQF